jgi:hypothetical protein
MRERVDTILTMEQAGSWPRLRGQQPVRRL